MKIDPVLVAIVSEIIIVVFVITMAFLSTRSPHKKSR